MSDNRVVITGLGVIAPNGIGIEEFWRNVGAGISGIEAYEWGRAFGFRSAAVGRVKDFDAMEHGVDGSAQRCQRPGPGCGRQPQFALAAARMAVEDAGLDTGSLDRTRFGVSIASAIADAAAMEANLLLLTDNGLSEVDPARVAEGSFDAFDFGLAAARVAREFGAEGSVSNLSTGCTAGLDALGFALERIRNGEADVMLAGASEAPLCPLSIGSFEALGALSTRDVDAAARASCPFSAERDGFVIAEGCGILVLESHRHAVQRGARIYAELAGYASVNNAYHMTDLPPEGEALARCIHLALADAGSTVDDIHHISAHGSSTPQNDANETGAIKAVFGAHAPALAINSLKSMTGHALAAANAIESVALSLEIKHQKLHPTINYRVADPQCDLDYVPNRGRAARIGSAVKLSSGFSGIHSVIVMRAV